MTPICTIKGCGYPVRVISRGWCTRHYERWRHYGDPEAGGPLRIMGDDWARFWSYVDLAGPLPERRPELGPCHLWTGAASDGYGFFRVAGVSRRAYAWHWEQVNGPIVDELDHLCRVHPCVRLTHLEDVPTRVNGLRGESFAAQNARKTRCDNGHDYTPENTYWRPSGGRDCRTCRRLRSAELKARRRAIRTDGTITARRLL